MAKVEAFVQELGRIIERGGIQSTPQAGGSISSYTQGSI